MIVGHSHQLHVSSVDVDTVWLRHANGEDIPLPVDEAPNAKPDDKLTVFIFTDADANPIATTEKPRAELGQCAHLRVTSITNAGAFLNWGITKELLLPFNEQRRPLEVGMRESILV